MSSTHGFVGVRVLFEQRFAELSAALDGYGDHDVGDRGQRTVLTGGDRQDSRAEVGGAPGEVSDRGFRPTRTASACSLPGRWRSRRPPQVHVEPHGASRACWRRAGTVSGRTRTIAACDRRMHRSAPPACPGRPASVCWRFRLDELERIHRCDCATLLPGGTTRSRSPRVRALPVQGGRMLEEALESGTVEI